MDNRHPLPHRGGMAALAQVDGSPPLVVVGASAGGVEALRDLVSALPSGLPACILIVLHMPPDAPSALPAILRRAGDMSVRQAQDGDQLQAGQVLVAQPDHHLVIVDGRVAVTRGPKENGHRPAVDVLFRSAARARRSDVLGLVLSGVLDDGAAGAVAIEASGGRVAVQSFAEALYEGMPRAAAHAAGSAHELPVAQMARLIGAWAEEHGQSAAEAGDIASGQTREVGMATLDPEAMHDPDRPGDPSGFGCPDCAGALFRIEEGRLVRYRCRVGHAWSAESLLARQAVDLESALWMALRSLEEQAALNAELGERVRGSEHARTAARFDANAQDAVQAAELVRQLIADIGTAADAQAESQIGIED
jgi:two-component system, chemotaxis family, protein-glutamate methylesterase/glutaminase